VLILGALRHCLSSRRQGKSPLLHAIHKKFADNVRSRAGTQRGAAAFCLLLHKPVGQQQLPDILAGLIAGADLLDQLAGRLPRRPAR
jgi:hypothetical protein